MKYGIFRRMERLILQWFIVRDLEHINHTEKHDPYPKRQDFEVRSYFKQRWLASFLFCTTNPINRIKDAIDDCIGRDGDRDRPIGYKDDGLKVTDYGRHFIGTFGFWEALWNKYPMIIGIIIGGAGLELVKLLFRMVNS